LTELARIVEGQKIQPVITPTPTIVEVPTASPSPSPTPTPTQIINDVSLRPLSQASSILKTALDFQPNAQFILLKTDPATVDHGQPIISKYFFRQDLNTKKYFYVMVTGTSQPEIIDKNIQVTPDNNLPSLNDLVLENKLGLDLNEALDISQVER